MWLTIKSYLKKSCINAVVDGWAISRSQTPKCSSLAQEQCANLNRRKIPSFFVSFQSTRILECDKQIATMKFGKKMDFSCTQIKDLSRGFSFLLSPTFDTAPEVRIRNTSHPHDFCSLCHTLVNINQNKSTLHVGSEGIELLATVNSFSIFNFSYMVSRSLASRQDT